MGELKRTPLYEKHKEYGGKIIDFAGWELPVQYEGIIPEHQAVRNSAGLFDVSHMGEVEVNGRDALEFLQNLVTNNVSKLEKNQVLYTMMCYENGGVVDDLLVYKFDNDDFLLVINASNIEKDLEWILKQSKEFDVNIENISTETAQLALQGPASEQILQKLTKIDLSSIRFFYCLKDVRIDGINCLISRTGYTGEDGFEIYTSNQDSTCLWDKIIEAGKEYGIKPVGLGARDTLRFEASLPLYGNEISQDITPLEAGLGFFVKLDKDNFIGKESLLKQKKKGISRKTVGFEMKRGIPRHNYEVFFEDKKIGFVTTGYHSPTLKKNIGLAIVDAEYTGLEKRFEVKIRNKMLPATIISRYFLRKNYKK